jgi:hypothetical protein
MTVLETIEADAKEVVAKVEDAVSTLMGKAETTASADVVSLRDTLTALGLIVKGDVEKTDQEIIELSASVVAEYNAIIRNAGIVINHALDCFKSMAERNGGILPDELVKGTPVFKQREGYKDLKLVLDQILPVFQASARAAQDAPGAKPPTT